MSSIYIAIETKVVLHAEFHKSAMPTLTGYDLQYYISRRIGVTASALFRKSLSLTNGLEHFDPLLWKPASGCYSGIRSICNGCGRS